jgi:hypothetical protein
MAEDNPLTVFVAENERVAQAMVALLAGEGIDATAGPITGAASAELEIRVTDPSRVVAAKALVASAMTEAATRAAGDKRAARSGTVTSTCEECGKASEWPASAMGTTQDCPACGAYMDIPDPDEDWSGVDFGRAEDDNDEGKVSA